MPRPFKRLAASDSASQLGEILFHINGVFFLHDLVKSGISHDDRIQNRKSVILKMVLLQEGKALALGDNHFAVGRLKLT